jgi:hypothetical protein
MKFCSSCKQDKSITEFAKNAFRKDGLQTACKACQKIQGAARYQLTKKEHYESNKKRRLRNQIAIYKYLLTHPCVDCGITDPAVLTFDHVRGEKRWNVSDVSRHSFGLATIFDEIAKCEVRCFNCHMRKDSPRIGGDRWNALNEAATELKSSLVPLLSLPAEDQHISL